jgi:hypothetical protein
MQAKVWGHLCTWEDVLIEALRLLLLQIYSQVGILGYSVHEEPSFPYMPVSRFLLVLKVWFPLSRSLMIIWYYCSEQTRFNIARHWMLFEFSW